MKKITLILTVLLITITWTFAQEEKISELEISGNLLTDQRFLLSNKNQWAWNENRLTLKLNKKVAGNSKFHSEIWLRNIGLPNYYSTSALVNKGIIDPYNLEIREAYVQINGFLTKNLDLTIGRQQIVWGTADKINPTNNLNPYDFEDILDFGRQRGSDAFRADYYINNDFLLEAVFIPFYKPSNLPIGIFSDIMFETIELPEGMILANFSDSLLLPEHNLKEDLTAGFKFKAYYGGIDFSFSYVYGHKTLPMASIVDITTLDTNGHVDVSTDLYFPREHIFGFDFSTNIAGIGFWGEIAAFLATDNIIMTTNIHTVNPYTFQPITISSDSTLLEKNKPYFKYVVGADYTFGNGIYTNIQYIHGFINETGNENLNDYFFFNIEKGFFYDKLKISPLSGAFIISNFDDLKNNYTYVYMPEICYNPTDNFQIKLSTAIIDGKGKNIFNSLKDLDMFILKVKYSF